MAKCFYTEQDLFNAIRVLRANNARTIKVQTDYAMGQKYYKVEWSGTKHNFDNTYWDKLF